MSGTDPLLLFHESVINNREVVLDDKTVIFDLGNGKLRREPISLPTAFIQKTGLPATLENIYWAYANRGQRWANYFKAVAAKNLQPLILRDFGTLVTFFENGDLHALIPQGQAPPPQAAPEIAPSASVPAPQSSLSSGSSHRQVPQREFSSRPPSTSSRSRVPKTPPRSDAKRSSRSSSTQSSSSSHSTSEHPTDEPHPKKSRTPSSKDIDLVDDGIFRRPPIPPSPATEDILANQRS